MPPTRLSRQQPRKRRACDVCYTQKIKCVEIAGSKACDWCTHHQRACTFNRPQKGKTKSASGSPKYLQPETEPEQNATPKTSTLFRYSGIQFFSSRGREIIGDICGPSDILDQQLSQGFPWEAHDHQLSTPPDNTASSGEMSFPDRFVVEACKALYQCSEIGLLYPLVHMPALHSAVDLVYSEEDQRSRKATIARAFVLAFVAFCSTAGHRRGMTFPVRSERLAAMASDLLHPLLSGDVSLDVLQTTVILAIYYCIQGKLQTGQRLLAQSARLIDIFCQNMPLVEANSDLTPCERNHLLIVIWIVFIIDQELFFRLATPPVILAEDMRGGRFGLDVTVHLPHLDGRGLNLIYHFQLAMIMSRIYSYLYAPSTPPKSDIEILKAVCTLDTELEAWRLSLPPDYRPSIWNPDVPGRSRLNFETLVLSLKYDHCLGQIHQVVDRCRMWDDNAVNSTLQSSLVISTQANRSSIHLLRSTDITPTCEIFWLLFYYPISALIKIFCKVVMNPADENTTADLNILAGAPGVLGGLQTHDLTTVETKHLQFMVTFTRELHSLAVKAARGSGGTDAV